MTAEWLQMLQWPAMAITIGGAWMVASTQPLRRNIGFWLYLLSNVLWVACGLHAHALALIGLQFCLAAMNIRGAFKADKAAGNKAPAT
jgi:hypothetical protein